MAMSERIGIFGGSFNPVHLGHLVMAQDALEHMGLHRVIFVPAAHPPHKPGAAMAGAADRLEMLKIALSGHPRFEVSDEEIARGGVSYTVDTLRRLREKWPDASLYFIIGGDTIRELHTWRDIDQVLRLAEVVTVGRPGIPLDNLTSENLRLPDPWPARLAANVVGGHLVEISSSDIRSRLARGRSIRYLVPEGVERYISSHRLYMPQETSR